MGLSRQILVSVGCAERDVKEQGAQVASQIEAAPRRSTQSAPGSPPPAIQICEMMAVRLLRAWDIMSRSPSASRPVRSSFPVQAQAKQREAYERNQRARDQGEEERNGTKPS